ncbi:hypothetical protein DVH05_012453 [Phytophthora capsici]|nr:hypothetical protein DVH05_012453 [Phytophthora capsici]
MLGAWKAMARRQLERRVEAEQQQKLLRAEVVGRARLVQQMHTLLRGKFQNSQSDPVLSWRPMERTEDPGSSDLHKTLIAELDGHYARTDAVFADLEFKKAVSMAYSLSRKWQDDVLYFDSADRVVFPHTFEEAADAISIVMMSGQGADIDRVRIQDVKDTIAMTFEVKYKLSPQKDANIVIYGVGRRYVEKDRLVLLWRAFTEGRGEFEGCQSNETIWMVVRPSSDVSDANCGDESTVADCYSRLVPINLESTCASGSDVDLNRFVKIVAESGEKDSKQLTEMMKRLMIRGPCNTFGLTTVL